MKQNLFVIAIGGALTIAVIVSLVWMSTVKEDTGRLTMAVAELKDSVALLSRVIDTLKAQTPGLGEYMSTIQLHVSKLWFAARASNWRLAKYEHDELNETIEAAERLHARKDGVDITAVLQSVRETQLPLMEHAIAKADFRAFRAAYTQTLAACNGCHQPAGYGFIHIIVPTREPVTNQQWGDELR